MYIKMLLTANTKKLQIVNWQYNLVKAVMITLYIYLFIDMTWWIQTVLYLADKKESV